MIQRNRPFLDAFYLEACLDSSIPSRQMLLKMKTQVISWSYFQPRKMETAIATQHMLTYGLSLSPIRADFQKMPRILADRQKLLYTSRK